jgi:acyl-CoA synthetase (AMP-forming)/AMP-acid ligase II
VNASAPNLARYLTNTARLYPDETALVHGEQRWTWREINQRVDAMAAALEALGLRPGDRVIVQSPNNVYLFESPYAIMRAGGVYVSVNARQSAEETAYIAQDSGARILLVDESLADLARAARESSPSLEHAIVMGSAGGATDAAGTLRYEALVKQHRGATRIDFDASYDDPAWLVYTSGTTGRPKGAVQTHGQMTFVLVNRLADVLQGLDHRDGSLVIAPLSHGAANLAFCCTIRGAKSVIPASAHLDEDECWRLIAEHRLTSLFTVPTILMRLIRHPAVDRYDHSSLRHVLYAGAPITRVDQKLALAKLGRVLIQYYGQAECNGSISVLYPDMHSPDDDDPMAPTGTCGVVRTGMQLAIMDDRGTQLPPGEVGEICVRGPAVFAGYFGKPEETAAIFHGSWLRTRDLGRVDERGFVYIVGRAQEMYISGGFNVYPNETEDYIARHPAVAEVAVVSLPDRHWGEIGVAAVTLKSGATATEAEIMAFIRTKLADYKCPKRVFFVASLPKSDYGKITKRGVRDMLYERGLLKRES